MFKLLKKTNTTRSYQCSLNREDVNQSIAEEQESAIQKGIRDVEQITYAAFNKVLQKHILEIQDKEKITVLNILNMELDKESSTTEDKAPILCTINLECLPHVPTEDLKNKKHTNIEFTPKEGEIEEVAKKELLIKAGDFVDQLIVEDNSLVEVKISCLVDNKPLPAYTAQRAVIDMQKKEFWPEILAALKGKKIGDSFKETVDLKETSSPLLKNKKALFSVNVLGIKTFIPAQNADDASAIKVGFKSLKDFLRKFEEHTLETAQKTIKELHHRALMEIVANLDFDLPDSIKAERMKQQEEHALNAILPRKKLTEDELRFVHASALNEAKLVTFVLSYAKQKNISVTNKEVQAFYTPKTPEEREFYEGIILEGKVLGEIEKHLIIEKKSLSFKELQDAVSKQ